MSILSTLLSSTITFTSKSSSETRGSGCGNCRKWKLKGEIVVHLVGNLGQGRHGGIESKAGGVNGNDGIIGLRIRGSQTGYGNLRKTGAVCSDEQEDNNEGLLKAC